MIDTAIKVITATTDELANRLLPLVFDNEQIRRTTLIITVGTPDDPNDSHLGGNPFLLESRHHGDMPIIFAHPDNFSLSQPDGIIDKSCAENLAKQVFDWVDRTLTFLDGQDNANYLVPTIVVETRTDPALSHSIAHATNLAVNGYPASKALEAFSPIDLASYEALAEAYSRQFLASNHLRSA